MLAYVSYARDHVASDLVFERARPYFCMRRLEVSVDPTNRDLRSGYPTLCIEWAALECWIGKTKWVGILRTVSKDWSGRGSIVIKSRENKTWRIPLQVVFCVPQGHPVTI